MRIAVTTYSGPDGLFAARHVINSVPACRLLVLQKWPAKGRKFSGGIRLHKALGKLRNLIRLLLSRNPSLYDQFDFFDTPLFVRRPYFFLTLKPGVSVFDGDINSDDCQRFLEKKKIDLLVVIGGRIIKGRIIGIPRHGVVNLHTGILPLYRGMASEFWTLYRRDYANAGFSIHFITEEIDAGEIIFQKRVRLEKGDGVHGLHRKNMVEGAQALADVLLAFSRNGRIDSRAPKGRGEVFSSPTKDKVAELPGILRKDGLL